MICPFRITTITDLEKDLLGTKIYKREVYPDCEGNRCPYYQATSYKSKYIYGIKKETCKLARKTIL